MADRLSSERPQTNAVNRATFVEFVERYDGIEEEIAEAQETMRSLRRPGRASIGRSSAGPGRRRQRWRPAARARAGGAALKPHPDWQLDPLRGAWWMTTFFWFVHRIEALFGRDG